MALKPIDEYIEIYKTLVANGVPNPDRVAIEIMEIKPEQKQSAIGFEIITEDDDENIEA
jgi:hypothetical protein